MSEVDESTITDASPWKHEEKTYVRVFSELQHRMQQCMEQSAAFRACQAEADSLYEALKAAPVTDTRLNYIGEQHRIMVRASALRKALEKDDPNLRHLPWTSPLISATDSQSSSSIPAAAPMEPPAERLQLDKGDVTPFACLQSTCLLLAALFEKTPFSDTDIRKKVHADFTMLKREFREDDLPMLHGNTTNINELFSRVKDLDKRGLADNILGIVFDDWTVHKRVDAFLNAELRVQVMCLTSDGPVGRLFCRFRSFVTISMLQQRLLKELYETKFASQPMRGYEPMTLEDPLDHLDFIEAMVRNTPPAYSQGKGMYYAWLYAPEVNASPELWKEVFGPGANCLPSLFDKIDIPDDGVFADSESISGYSMNLKAALKHDFSSGSSQAAVGFPWADDLLGAFLRKLQQQHREDEEAMVRQAEAAVLEAQHKGSKATKRSSASSKSKAKGKEQDAAAAAAAAAPPQQQQVQEENKAPAAGAAAGAAEAVAAASPPKSASKAARGSATPKRSKAGANTEAPSTPASAPKGTGKAKAHAAASNPDAGATQGPKVEEAAANGTSPDGTKQCAAKVKQNAVKQEVKVEALELDGSAGASGTEAAAAAAAAHGAKGGKSGASPSSAPATTPAAAATSPASNCRRSSRANKNTKSLQEPPSEPESEEESDEEPRPKRVRVKGKGKAEQREAQGAKAQQQQKEAAGKKSNAKQEGKEEKEGAQQKGGAVAGGKIAPQSKKRKTDEREQQKEGGKAADAADADAAGPGPSSEAAAAAAGEDMSRLRKRAVNPVLPPMPIPKEKVSLPLGIFLVGIICSSSYTNTQLHVEDLLLMSINVNIFGAPKLWWWIPQEEVPAFKAFAETMTPGGRDDLYTKSIAPFQRDMKLCPPEHILPLDILRDLGARRAIQMPGMAMLTSPGYAFHFTVSMGFNIAESCNMFLEMLGWTFDKLWKERPAEQYPDEENSMAQWMYESGILTALGVEPGKLHG